MIEQDAKRLLMERLDECLKVHADMLDAQNIGSIYELQGLSELHYYLKVEHTCSTKRKMLRIAGDDKPAEVVRSRLKKLNADHIRFVLNSLAENATPVRNMKQYLLVSLYNAPTTMNLH